ncbi:MAG TPA: Rne/Rng family ribonuclease [Terriglobales bacterium]|jgi:ribonuclease G|nr:Rne/Rng family ribonuclease [Terriglobales bacterium]
MTKELFVSSTPHETKVGLVEDDLLAEIYLERENEYTLAGSIYKGRVTRVLPGMQSAFVDIGLERDAFLYVSDFMELQDEDEVEEIPTNLAPSQPYQSPARSESQPAITEPGGVTPITEPHAAPEQHPESGAPAGATHEKPNGGATREGRGDWRSRRRRGRRGERMPESKFARPAVETTRPDRQERTDRPERNDRPERSERHEYGPPPGYQPIILPGESISKYQRLAQAQPSQRRAGSRPADPSSDAPAPIAALFPEDEPLFASPQTDQQSAAEPQPQTNDRAKSAAANAQVGSSDWDREQKRLHEMNVAAVFGGAVVETSEAHEHGDSETKFVAGTEPSEANHPSHTSSLAAEGTIVEEEIEEEEAELGSYTEELDEDETFEEEELEEETRHAADYLEPATQEIAASAEPSSAAEKKAEPFVIEGGIDENAASEEVFDPVAEQEAKEAEEAELEEAQAEAEALLDAEARGDGTVDVRVEVRAPAATAAYTQRAARPAFDPRRGQRGRRGGGGRRFRRQEPQNVPLITELLKEGQEILVQIAKEPIGKKGARITSHIALPGRFLVYMPTVNHTGVSRKISSEEERQRLKRIIISERDNGHGGFIVRTAAQGASEEELRADIRFLKNLWSEIKTRADNGKGPTLIYHDLNVVERVLRDQVTSDFTAIWVDTEQEYERVLRFANRFQPALVRRVKLYSKEVPLFEQFGLNDEINKALKSKVWLKSGGYIVINQTEALVAIDVNTGKYVGKTARLEDTIVKTNVDAIKEIVRQIRLRDLGGIIIIDFIDMDERRNRQKVMQALEEALRSDRAPSKVLQFNDFGLVAITRKRVKQSLERTIGSPCPYCESTGYVKSVTTVCNDIYVEMRKMAKHLDHADVMLRVNPEIAKALKSNNGRFLTEMEELTKRTVIVKSDPALHQEQFDIN